jgi:hypothetical protein
MEKQLLREPEIFPSKEVLKNILGEVYNVLEALETQLTQDEFALTFDWNYYKDGKSWLCKVVYKKKTIFWLSVWDGFFRTSFFFLDRHLDGIAALHLDETNYFIEKEWGKMIPIIFNINDKKPFADLLKIIKFKKEAK